MAENNNDLCDQYIEDIAACELITTFEKRPYTEEMTPIEKAEADDMARKWVEKNGEFVMGEVRRVIKVLDDPQTDMPRAGRRVLRAYMDSLIEVKRSFRHN